MTSLLHHDRPHTETVLNRRSSRGRVSWHASLPSALIEKICADPFALLAEGEVLHKKLNCTVARISEHGNEYIFKHQDSGKFLRRLKKSLSAPPAAQSWQHGLMLRKLGVRTPQPLALLERKVGPFHTSCFLLTEYVPGTTLYRLVRSGTASRAVLQHIAEQIADLWEQLDRHAICHNDLKPENLLVDANHRVWLIDFDRLMVEPNVATRCARQVNDLRDLLHPRSWRRDLAAADLVREALVRKTSVARLCQAAPKAGKLLSSTATSSGECFPLLTVLIPTCNAAETIERCIKSVSDIADEILVADAGSTDGTVEIVREIGGCRIVQQHCDEPTAFAGWAQRQARHPWTLLLAPQEQLNPELGRQVQDALAAAQSHNGYLISRAMQYRGRRLEFGDFRRAAAIRLYRSELASFHRQGEELQVTIPAGRLGKLRSSLIWELAPSVEPAAQPLAAGGSASHCERATQRTATPGTTGRTLRRLLRSFVIRGGWLDGHLGWQAALQAAGRNPQPTWPKQVVPEQRRCA